MTEISVAEILTDSGITVVEVTIPGPQGVPGTGVSLGGTLADGDYGDIAVSGGGSIMTYDGTVPVNKGGTGQTTEAEALGEMTQALAEDTTPDRANDFLMTYDASADTGKKAKIETVADVVKDLSPQLGASLDANSFNIGFDDNTGIDDDSGNETLRFRKAVSAVSYLDVSNASAFIDEGECGPSIAVNGAMNNLNLKVNDNNSYINFYSENYNFGTQRGAYGFAREVGNGVVTVNFMDNRQSLGSAGTATCFLVPSFYDSAGAIRYGTYFTFTTADRTASHIRTGIFWSPGDDSYSAGGGYGHMGAGLTVGSGAGENPGDGIISLTQNIRVNDGKGILSRETNNPELLLFISAATAVNEFTISNGATGTSPSLAATGNDTDIDVVLTPKGAGVAKVVTDRIATLSQENQPLTGGVTVTEKDLGTVTTGTTTLDMGDRPMHKYTNNGAHTLAPGAVIGSTLIAITNGASAGAITTSGWTKVAGDSFTTTNAHKFLCSASVSAVGSLLTVQAMQ